MADSRDIIIRPVISEKTTLLRLSRKYEFVVSPFANKIEIKRAVEDIFDVKVEKINIVNKKGKEKRMGMYVGKTPAYKRALVTLAEGHSISFFEGL